MNYDIKIRTLLEDEILGWLLIYDDAKLRSRSIMYRHGINNSEFFANAFNQDVFTTMQKCWENNLPADLVNVINFRPDNYRDPENAFEKKGFDSQIFLMNNKATVFGSDMFEKKLWTLKQFILMDYWNKMATSVLHGTWDFRDNLQVGQNIIDGYEILFESLTRDFVKQESVADKQRKLLEKIKQGQQMTVMSGISSLDVFTGGWFNGELIVCAGRPGMGKTSMALIMAIMAAFYFKKKILFITLEMPKVQLMNKIIAHQLKLDYHRLKKLDYDDETLEKVFRFYDFLQSMESNLIILDKKEAGTVSQIYKKVEEIKPNMLVVDYLQLTKIESTAKVKAGNREQEISYISSSFKDIAVLYDIPVMALSQLSRAVEARMDKRPMLSDLRESGTIEQDADIVIFYYRDAYYKEKLHQFVTEDERWDLEIIFAKGRDLGTKTIYVNANYMTYEVKDRMVPTPP